jgi:hypothetical protein
METRERMVLIVLVILAAIAGGYLAVTTTHGDDTTVLASAIISAVSVLVIAAQLKLFSIDRTTKEFLAQMRREYDQKLFDQR